MKNKESDNIVKRTAEMATRRLSGIHLRKTVEEEGIIESVMIVDRVVYVIARRVRAYTYTPSGHEYFALFNNERNIQEDVLSSFELFLPLSNIDLATTTIIPEDLLGKYVLVSLLNGKAVKATYIGNVKAFEQTPLQVLRSALENARSLAGVGKKITEVDKATKYLKEVHNVSSEQLELLNNSLKDFQGKVIRVEGDAVYDRDTATKKDVEVVIKSHDFIRDTNQQAMKTRNCHLPVSIFSAR